MKKKSAKQRCTQRRHGVQEVTVQEAGSQARGRAFFCCHACCSPRLRCGGARREDAGRAQRKHARTCLLQDGTAWGKRCVCAYPLWSGTFVQWYLCVSTVEVLGVIPVYYCWTFVQGLENSASFPNAELSLPIPFLSRLPPPPSLSPVGGDGGCIHYTMGCTHWLWLRCS